MRYAVRPMRSEDVPQVEEIDRECFPTQWPTLSFGRQLLANRLSYYLVVFEPAAHHSQALDAADHDSPSPEHRLSDRLRRFFEPDRPSLALPAERIVGMVGFWVMAGEAHISTIGVRQAYRRHGLGELLLMSAIELAQLLDADVVTLEVRASNSPAQSLYEKYGFSRTGVRRGYYSDREDAVIMTTEPITSASFRSHLQGLKQTYAQVWGRHERQLT